jgi:hypothetical protein
VGGAHIPTFFFYLVDAPELKPRATARFLRGHAGGHEVGNPLIEMEAKLSIEMLLGERSSEEALIPTHNFTSILVSD